jgi:DNA-directed RNA polymerase specialized sigma24 family protein
MTDEEKVVLRRLVDQARGGNQTAMHALWLCLYIELGSLITRGLRKRGVAKQDEEDAVHDVLIAVMGKLQELRSPDAFLSYLIRVEQHIARMYRLRRFTLMPESVDRLPASVLNSPLHARVPLARLRWRQAKVIELVYVEGYTYAEVAGTLNCSIGGAKKMAQRAIQQMRRLLA